MIYLIIHLIAMYLVADMFYRARDNIIITSYKQSLLIGSLILIFPVVLFILAALVVLVAICTPNNTLEEWRQYIEDRK